MAEESDTADHKGLKYSIRLLIGHPEVDPALITDALGIAPTGPTWFKGAPRKTPKGTPLPGVYAGSLWSHSIDVRDKRSFFDEVIQLLDRLEPKADFLSRLVDSGGRVTLIVDLFGDRNIGDVIGWETLKRFGALRVNLGVEVF